MSCRSLRELPDGNPDARSDFAPIVGPIAAPLFAAEPAANAATDTAAVARANFAAVAGADNCPDAFAHLAAVGFPTDVLPSARADDYPDDHAHGASDDDPDARANGITDAVAYRAAVRGSL